MNKLGWLILPLILTATCRQAACGGQSSRNAPNTGVIYHFNENAGSTIYDAALHKDATSQNAIWTDTKNGHGVYLVMGQSGIDMGPNTLNQASGYFPTGDAIRTHYYFYYSTISTADGNNRTLMFYGNNSLHGRWYEFFNGTTFVYNQSQLNNDFTLNTIKMQFNQWALLVTVWRGSGKLDVFQITASSAVSESGDTGVAADTYLDAAGASDDVVCNDFLLSDFGCRLVLDEFGILNGKAMTFGEAQDLFNVLYSRVKQNGG